MTRYDAFNGDADGICALTQYRLAHPAESVLVTGVKRDTALLERIQAQPGDEVLVLDVSLDKNREALVRILAQGASVLYADHHFAGEVPKSPRLTARIDTRPNRCTSLVIHDHLGGPGSPNIDGVLTLAATCLNEEHRGRGIYIERAKRSRERVGMKRSKRSGTRRWAG